MGWLSLVEQGKVPRDHMMLIRRFQYIHDSIELEDWEDRIKQLYTQAGLIYAESIN